MVDPGEWDWLNGLLDTGTDAASNLGDLFFDTDTGMFVDAGSVDPSSVMDFNVLDNGGIPSDPYPAGPQDFIGPQNYDWEAASAGETGMGAATPEEVAATTPFNAPDLGGSSSGWGKALAQGLQGLLGGSGLGSGLGSVAGGGGNPGLVGSVGGVSSGAPSYGTPSPLDAAVPGIPSPMDLGGVPGLQGLARLPTPDPVSATLMHLQADPGPRVGLQAPIDPGPAPVRFTPLMPTTSAPGTPAPAAMPQPRLSGIQRLMLERFG